MAFRRILKLPVFAAEKEAREQIIRAITCSVPLINLTKSMAVHRLWADCFESVVSRVLKKEQLNRENTVILSAWFSAEAIAGAGLKRKYPEMRFVSLAHSFELDKLKNAYIAYDYTVKKHQYCDHIFFVSEMMRKQYYRDLKELLPQKEWSKTSVIYLGSRKLYPDRFVPASTDGILRLLSVSDVIPVKRIDRIIDSLAVWDGIDIEWTHFGSGALLGDMKKRAAKKLDGNVHVTYRFMGEVNNKKIHEYYNSYGVDLYLNVSVTEGVPIVLRECMCYGVPAIATDVGGNSEIITDRTGILLDKDFSNEEFCNAIKKYIEMTDEEKENMRTAAFDHWKEKFDSEVITRKLLWEICG